LSLWGSRIMARTVTCPFVGIPGPNH
jgi:hypothetical protein